MKEQNELRTLKRFPALSAAETSGVLVFSLPLHLSVVGAFTWDNAESVVQWTLWLLRVAVWALMFVSAGRLVKREWSFRHVRGMLLLRFAAWLFCIAFGGFQDLSQLSGELSMPLSTYTVRLNVALLAVTVLSDVLVSPLTVFSLLKAEEKLLFSLGAEEQGRWNRRTGIWLLALTIAVTLLFCCFASIVIYLWQSTDTGLLTVTAGGTPFNRGLEGLARIALLLFFLLWLVCLVVQVIAAVEMQHTWRAVRAMER